ncbi:MAG: TonB-dependent receptor, partial [Flavobacterium psychrophilum]
NGIYANTSYGKSDMISFDNFGVKGGAVYKLTGRHMLSFNGVYMTKAPTLRNTFPNARLNNAVVDGLESENIYSGDLSYIIRAPKLKARVTGFMSRIDNSTETSFFFAEGVVESIDGDADTNAFVAETVTGINKQQMGVELGIEYQFTPTIKAMLSASYGQYTYANNPNVSINNDALAADLININPGSTGTATTNFGKAYLKDYKLPGMPQQAASLGIEYRDPKFWWVGANANYLGANYIDVSALLRTDNFLIDPETGHQFIEATDERTRQLLKQEKFDDFFLFNLNGGKSWKIGNSTLGFFASINNVFNTTYKTGGFEQARNANYRQLNQDVSSGTPAFGPRYFYGYGRTYFVNLYINL